MPKLIKTYRGHDILYSSATMYRVPLLGAHRCLRTITEAEKTIDKDIERLARMTADTPDQIETKRKILGILGR